MIIKKYNVKAINLKKLAKREKIDYVDLIKIDTEGHEFQVLQGAGEFLKKSVRYIIVEFHNSNIFINYDPIKIEKYLKKNNFVLKKSFNFPFTTWEDRIYYNKKLIK